MNETGVVTAWLPAGSGASASTMPVTQATVGATLGRVSLALGGGQLGSEPWRGTVDASLLLIDEIDCPRARRSLT
jgi:hypothetical protein